MPKQQQQQQQQQQRTVELENFKQWVFSLEKEELLDAMSFTFQSIPGGGSHDYDLLLEMVRLQSPPPTPIHNKAMGYMPCSRKGARLDYALREEERLRWTQPRLFRFYCDEQATIRRSNASTRRGQLHLHNILEQQNQRWQRYRIRASKLVTISPWGEFYGVGSTIEQQQTDEEIILGTRLSRSSTITIPEKTASFVVSDQCGTGNKCILRMLHVTSRGNFLRTTHTDKSYPSFFAPWLKPTQCWFSLSRYLASRYEMALWESYRRHKRQDNTLRWSRCGIERWRNCSTVDVQRVVNDALCRVLKEALTAERTNLQIENLRDGMIWSMIDRLSSDGKWMFRPTNHAHEAFAPLTQLPLIEIDSPYSNHFQSLVLDQLEVCLVQQLEQDSKIAGKELSDVANGSVVERFSINKKRKTKRNKKKNRNGRVRPSQGAVLLPAIPADSEEEGDEDIGEVQEHYAIEFPNNATSSRQRNRNIISVLEILDEILEEASVKVGLPRTPAFVDQREIEKREMKRKLTPAPASKSDSVESNLRPRPSIKQAKEACEAARSGQSCTMVSGERGTTGVIARPSSFVLEATEQYRNPQLYAPWGVPSATAFQTQFSEYSAGLYTFAPFSHNNNNYQPAGNLFPVGYHDPFSLGRNLMLAEDDAGVCSDGIDTWPFLDNYNTRDESIFSDLFQSQDSDDDDEGRPPHLSLRRHTRRPRYWPIQKILRIL
jgi:hypothetical protein